MLPMLLLMIDGVLELGLMFHNQSVLTSATRIAARAGVAAGVGKPSVAQMTALATAYCQDNLISPGAKNTPVVEVEQSNDAVYPNPLRVSIRYQFNGLIMGGGWGMLTSNPTLQASTVMYNE